MTNTSNASKIPLLDLSPYQKDDEICKSVREACERYGCFVLNGDKSCEFLHEDMFKGMEMLFDLPEHTKSKYQKPKPYRSYSGNSPFLPLHETFGGIDDPSAFDSCLSFTNLMWPQGNTKFCSTLNTIAMKMIEMNISILRMLMESYRIEKKEIDSHVDDTTSMLRLIKYKAPTSSPMHGSQDTTIGLVAHTDKNSISILCQNDVQALEVFTKDGQWVEVVIPKHGFVVIIGDALKAWSNGRVMAAKHRVAMKGDKDRYSIGMFTIPKDEATISTPAQFVDDDHPRLYRPFKFVDYLAYFISNISDDALEIYAGV